MPESRLSAHMLGDKPSLTTRVTKTTKAETRERSIEPEETSFVQMTFASEGIQHFASIKDSLKQSKLNHNLQFSQSGSRQKQISNNTATKQQL